ncbi:hypothetical protein JXB41_05280 [Candidatus Woesearchaeota archaeon]|nr:hypothetical protein [Candidatus Woesearchaeota archaeon]
MLVLLITFCFILFPVVSVVMLFILLDFLNSFSLRKFGFHIKGDFILIGCIICGHHFGLMPVVIMTLYILPKKIIFFPPINKPHIIKMPIFILTGYLASQVKSIYFMGIIFIIMRYFLEYVIRAFSGMTDLKRTLKMIISLIANVINFFLIYNIFSYFI